MKDGVITNMLVGSPAFLSHKFKRGDRVLKIDGEDVDESGAGLTKMLIGSDVPGTDVTVTVKREADNVFDVTLTRATTLELADKKKMFQLFAQIKDLAHQREDKGPNDSQNADDSIASSSDVGGSTARILPLVDAAVDLWTRMFEAVVTHDEMIAANVSGLMRAVDEDVCALDTQLQSLRGHAAELEASLNAEMIKGAVVKDALVAKDQQIASLVSHPCLVVYACYPWNHDPFSLLYCVRSHCSVSLLRCVCVCVCVCFCVCVCVCGIRVTLTGVFNVGAGRG